MLKRNRSNFLVTLADRKFQLPDYYSNDPIEEFSSPTLEEVIAKVRHDVDYSGLDQRLIQNLDNGDKTVLTGKLRYLHPYNPAYPTMVLISGFPICTSLTYYDTYLHSLEFKHFNIAGVYLVDSREQANEIETTLFGQLQTIARAVSLIDQAVNKAKSNQQKVYVLGGCEGGAATIYHCLTSSVNQQADGYFPLTARADYAASILDSPFQRQFVDSYQRRKKLAVYHQVFISAMPNNPQLKQKIFPIVSYFDFVVPGQRKFWRGYDQYAFPIGHSSDGAHYFAKQISSFMIKHINEQSLK